MGVNGCLNGCLFTSEGGSSCFCVEHPLPVETSHCGYFVSRKRFPLRGYCVPASRFVLLQRYSSTDPQLHFGRQLIRDCVFHRSKHVADVSVGNFRRHDRLRACLLAWRRDLRQYGTMPLHNCPCRRATALWA